MCVCVCGRYGVCVGWWCVWGDLVMRPFTKLKAWNVDGLKQHTLFMIQTSTINTCTAERGLTGGAK